MEKTGGKPERKERRDGGRDQKKRFNKKNDRRPQNNDQPWEPLTKLGKLVKAGKVSSLEEIFKFSIPIKEAEIVDFFMPEDVLKEEVIKIKTVQRQSAAGKRTRFKAIVVVGDRNGHVGVGVKVASETPFAIKGAIRKAKLNIVPCRMGYWGNKIGEPHTVPVKVTGQSGSVRVRLIPAPRGTGIIAARVPKLVLGYVGVQDTYTSSSGKTATIANFALATYNAIKLTYDYFTPDFWPVTKALPVPMAKNSKFLENYEETKKEKKD